MTALGPDEKVCPFCAEVIKVAAVKCRYCHSDLPAREEPFVAADVQDEPEEAPDPQSGAEPVPDTEPAPDSGPNASPVVTATGARSWDRVVVALAVLCAALLATLVIQVVRAVPDDVGTAGNDQVTSSSYRDAAMSAATEHITTLLSYSYKTLAEDQKKAEAVVTGSTAESYPKEMAVIGPAVIREKRTRVAKVQSASLVSIKKNEAQLLVFADIATTVNGAPSAADYKRILVTMTRDKGDWVISNTKDLLIN